MSLSVRIREKLPVVIFTLPLCAGCVGQPSAAGLGAIETVEQRANYLDADAGNDAGRSELEHDFGLLRPGQQVQHRFKITNNSDTTWTFKRFHINCVCTVTHASRPSIPPNQSAEVEVKYKAPSSSADDRRSVQVEFSEPGAPFLSLVVQARIREPITVTPSELSFNRVGRGEKPERSFEIHNFSDHDWSSVSVDTTAPWLTVQSVFVGNGNGPQEPRQVWRIVVRADTADLSSGKHQVILEVNVERSADGSSTTVPLNLLVASPVDAIPGSMFFGTVRKGEAATRKVLLAFASPTADAAKACAQIKHDLDGDLELEWRTTSERYAEITGTLRPKGTSRFVEGRITIYFLDGELPQLEVPVYAKVDVER